MTETGRLLGSGKEAEVFEYGALALKLYRSAASKASSFREAANLSILERLSARIRRAEGLDAASRKRLLLELDALPDGDRVCHGDFHPWNIHGSGQEFMIVDWLDACCGNPLADVCRTYVLLHHAMPERAMGYVEAYASVTGSEVSGILAWLPPIAAARLTEGVAHESDELLRLAGLSP
ncbi:phosphotransferase family protein [Rhizobium ruizarguesonis]